MRGTRLKEYLRPLAAGCAVALVVFLSSAGAAEAGLAHRLCDAFFVAGVLILGSGGLAYANYHGLRRVQLWRAPGRGYGVAVGGLSQGGGQGGKLCRLPAPPAEAAQFPTRPAARRRNADAPCRLHARAVSLPGGLAGRRVLIAARRTNFFLQSSEIT